MKTGKWVLPVISIALLLGAWSIEFMAHYHISRLDLSRFGNCDEVPGALARDTYVLSQWHPYLAASILLDAMAFMALFGSVIVDRFRILSFPIAALWLISAIWHCLAFLASISVFGL
jgi:hypothetical protein